LEGKGGKGQELSRRDLPTKEKKRQPKMNEVNGYAGTVVGGRTT